ncbi:VOC family protein [Actinocrispum wychmicini]|uniref:Putative glyoxalase superfamily protein PhnB n=1 Tax=Actinocrispum wychmicini TaxID=1213861 RepID=A0A4R2JEM7_9PSEU|nr:VOC family protein [Actinocrispum wychmicini]TCO56652.1 putative glyoxalase superfamily protein PhnB [Actinocrispum wychmicini]
MIWPCLMYRDAEAARVFLTEVFGFTEKVTVRDGDRIAHAEVAWPEGGGIMYGTVGNHPDYPQQVPGTQWVCVYTKDPDAVHERAVAAKATVMTEPYDAEYGARNVAIADSEGNVWTFGTYQGA